MKLYLSPEIDALCEKFGLEPREVACIKLLPDKAYVTVLLKDEGGHFYLRDDGEAAEKTLQFPLTVVKP